MLLPWPTIGSVYQESRAAMHFPIGTDKRSPNTMLGKHHRSRSCSAGFVTLLLLVEAFAFFVGAFTPFQITESSRNSLRQRNMSVSKKAKTDGGDEPTPGLQPIRAGFVGCGVIASSIATGLAAPEHREHLARHGLSIASISVTRRSESKSKKLREDFPGLVTVYDSPEDVVTNADIIFVCVLPEQLDTVLEDLTKKGIWRKDEHTLVSLVSTSNVDDLTQKSGLPSNRVYKMICLPPIAKREGCALVQPPASQSHPYLKDLLDALGGCVECANDDVMNAMMIPGCMMGPMYGVMRNTRDWLVKQGVPPKDASYFVGRSYLSIVQDAERDCRDPNRFDALIEEQTPGGLNEQSLRNLEGQKVFDAYDKAMDDVLARLQGK